MATQYYKGNYSGPHNEVNNNEVNNNELVLDINDHNMNSALDHYFNDVRISSRIKGEINNKNMNFIVDTKFKYKFNQPIIIRLQNIEYQCFTDKDGAHTFYAELNTVKHQQLISSLLAVDEKLRAIREVGILEKDKNRYYTGCNSDTGLIHKLSNCELYGLTLRTYNKEQIVGKFDGTVVANLDVAVSGWCCMSGTFRGFPSGGFALCKRLIKAEIVKNVPKMVVINKVKNLPKTVVINNNH